MRNNNNGGKIAYNFPFVKHIFRLISPVGVHDFQARLTLNLLYEVAKATAFSYPFSSPRKSLSNYLFASLLSFPYNSHKYILLQHIFTRGLDCQRETFTGFQQLHYLKRNDLRAEWRRLCAIVSFSHRIYIPFFGVKIVFFFYLYIKQIHSSHYSLCSKRLYRSRRRFNFLIKNNILPLYIVIITEREVQFRHKESIIIIIIIIIVGSGCCRCCYCHCRRSFVSSFVFPHVHLFFICFSISFDFFLLLLLRFPLPPIPRSLPHVIFFPFRFHSSSFGCWLLIRSLFLQIESVML